MMTAPTESRSRFSARPKVFWGNSIISPAMTSDSPWIRATPSARLTTVPSERASVSRFSSLIFFLIRSLISVALMDMLLPRFSSLFGEFVGELAQAAAHGGVDDGVTRADDDAADDGGIHAGADLHVASQALLHEIRHLPLLLRVQFVGGDDVHFGDPLRA